MSILNRALHSFSTNKDFSEHILSALLATSYFAVWTAIDWNLLQTFSFHIWDLGANFALTYGNAPTSLGYGHLDFAPQSLIYAFFIPVAKAFPNPFTLVIVQNAVLAIGGIFVYLLARLYLSSAKIGLLLEGLYLFGYGLFGASYFPIHYETFFGTFFLIAFYLIRVDRERLGAAFLVLAGLCSSLAAVTVPLFIVLLLWPEFRKASKRSLSGLLTFVNENLPVVLAGLIVVGSLLFAVEYAGLDVVISYGKFAGSGSAPNLAGGAIQNLQLKVIYIVLVVAPFGVALFRSRYSVLLVPYFVLVVISSSTHYALFSYPYTAIIESTLFVVLIESLKKASQSQSTETPSADKGSRMRTGKVRMDFRSSSLIQVSLVTIFLGLLILPFSPLNALAGPATPESPFDNYNLAGQTAVTPYDRALAEMGSMIPMQSSVLIQEDMPQFTNRAVWYEPGSYFGSPLVDYALTDPTSSTFNSIPPSFIGGNSTTMEEWFNLLSTTGQYGVKAEYQGAVLLERGFKGLPVLFKGFAEQVNASEFYGGTFAVNPTLGPLRFVTNETNGHEAFHSANGLFSLPPGNYTINYTLSTTVQNANSSIRIGLSSTLTGGSVAYRNVSGTDFASDSKWQNFTLYFSTRLYLSDLYFQINYTFWPGILAIQSASISQGPV